MGEIIDRNGRRFDGGGQGDGGNLERFAKQHGKVHQGITSWMDTMGKTLREILEKFNKNAEVLNQARDRILRYETAVNANASAINQLNENQHILEMRMAEIEKRLGKGIPETAAEDNQENQD